MSSQVAPGQNVPILVNNFKMSMSNSGKIYMYRVQFDQAVNSTDPRSVSAAFKSVKAQMESLFNVFLCEGTLIYSTTPIENL